MAETIKQPETESELKKQLLGNIQTQNSYDHVTQGWRNMDLLIKKNVYCKEGINKIY